jgi:hypothetical protein
MDGVHGQANYGWHTSDFGATDGFVREQYIFKTLADAKEAFAAMLERDFPQYRMTYNVEKAEDLIQFAAMNPLIYFDVSPQVQERKNNQLIRQTIDTLKKARKCTDLPERKSATRRDLNVFCAVYLAGGVQTFYDIKTKTMVKIQAYFRAKIFDRTDLAFLHLEFSNATHKRLVDRRYYEAASSMREVLEEEFQIVSETPTVENDFVCRKWAKKSRVDEGFGSDASPTTDKVDLVLREASMK